METFVITKAHVDQHGRYIGPEPKFKGNVLIKGGLGHVHFRHLHARGSIVAETGSSIKTDEGVSAGLYITVRASLDAGDDIKAGEDISAKTISAGLHITAGGGIWVGGDLTAGEGITAVGSITVSADISAGGVISAVGSIKAGGGVTAGDQK